MCFSELMTHKSARWKELLSFDDDSHYDIPHCRQTLWQITTFEIFCCWHVSRRCRRVIKWRRGGGVSGAMEGGSTWVKTWHAFIETVMTDWLTAQTPGLLPTVSGVRWCRKQTHTLEHTRTEERHAFKAAENGIFCCFWLEAQISHAASLSSFKKCLNHLNKMKKL